MREPGYYWVKYEGEWRIYEYYGDGYGWYLSRTDDEFDEIDENRIVRRDV
jgi:hypothetical protein